jgi:chromosome segregation ATPase
MTLQKIKDELAELKTTLANFIAGKGTADQASAFQGRLTAVEASVTSQAASIAEKDGIIVARDATIKELTSAAEKSKTDLTTANTRITDLTKEVETEKGRANATLAAQGLLSEEVPAATAKETPGGTGETAWAKYHRLLSSSPMEAGSFYQANADKILGSRPKQAARQ